MATNEIINLNHIDISTRNFKDERLAKATQRITSIYNDAAKYADTKNREIAKILGEVADKKAYEADGFSSVADYAYTVFGIARQNAYALANAGKVYNDKTAHPELQAMTPSKIAEIFSLDKNTVENALTSGKITHETTQKELREFAEGVKKSKEPEKPVIVDTFIARPCIPTFTDEEKADYSSARTIEEWDKWFSDHVTKISPETPVEIVKLSKGTTELNAKKATINRRLYFNRNYSVVVEFFKYTPPKAKKPATPKFTREQLLAMLEEMDTSEVEEDNE